MNIYKAAEVLKDLVDSTSRIDGRPLQYTSEEFREAYGEFVKRVNAAKITSEDLQRLAEGSAELAKHIEAARIGYEDLERIAESSVELAKNAQVAASKLIDVASMYPVGIAEKVNCTDDKIHINMRKTNNDNASGIKSSGERKTHIVSTCDENDPIKRLYGNGYLGGYIYG